jgi:hypothetical protein
MIHGPAVAIATRTLHVASALRAMATKANKLAPTHKPGFQQNQ